MTSKDLLRFHIFVWVSLHEFYLMFGVSMPCDAAEQGYRNLAHSVVG